MPAYYYYDVDDSAEFVTTNTTTIRIQHFNFNARHPSIKHAELVLLLLFLANFFMLRLGLRLGLKLGLRDLSLSLIAALSCNFLVRFILLVLLTEILKLEWSMT